jgi:hypothetical protein
VLAVSGGATWYMSTPFGRRGFFYREWNNSKSDFEKISVSADKCPRIPKQFLERERQNRPDFWFRQEFLCEFVETNKPFIEMARILAAVDPTITPLFPKGTF